MRLAFWKKWFKEKPLARKSGGIEYLESLKSGDKVRLLFKHFIGQDDFPHICTVTANMPSIEKVHVKYEVNIIDNDKELVRTEKCSKLIGYNLIVKSVIDLNKRAEGGRLHQP